MVTHTCGILEYSGYTHFPRPAEQHDNYDYDKDYDDDDDDDNNDLLFILTWWGNSGRSIQVITTGLLLCDNCPQNEGIIHLFWLFYLACALRGYTLTHVDL